jgi:ACR3 family arsenite efflux pump ArsB
MTPEVTTILVFYVVGAIIVLGMLLPNLKNYRDRTKIQKLSLLITFLVFLIFYPIIFLIAIGKSISRE